MTNESLKRACYPETHFGGFSSVDGTVAFYVRINSLVGSADVLLDVGCGRGRHAEDVVDYRRQLRIFKGKVRKVIGIDVDPSAASNPYLDAFALIPANGQWPLDAASVDCVVADFVLEHLADPAGFFQQVRRVLRPGGCFCARTPNKWGYIALGSRLIPERFHLKVLEVAQPNRAALDVFKTYYRCNTVAAIAHVLEEHGLEGCAFGYEGEPSYLTLSRFAYRLGVMVHRFTPRFFMSTIFVFARRGPD
jgi:SAM-dependent methyltransferase